MNIVIIKNPIDNTDMFWIKNTFTEANLPGPDYESNKKSESLKYILEKGRGVIDAGAHIGDYGLCLAHALTNLNRTDITVYCIEPTKSKCNFMNKIKRINGLSNVKIISKGLSDSSGKFSVKSHLQEAGFYSLQSNTGAWQWTPDPNGEEFTTLDELYKNNTIGEIGFVWLDAQWSEDKILSGGKKVLGFYKPYILMEYSPVITYHDDGVSVLNWSNGTKQELQSDERFQKLFRELNIRISEKGDELFDILLEFN